MKHFILALALFASAAFADAPLFRPAPPGLSASTAARIAKDHPSKNIVAVDPNPKALGTNIITVQLDGKTYRFVGEKRAIPAGDVWAPGASKPKPSKLAPEELWSGKTAEGDTAIIVNGRSGMGGEFSAGGKMYRMIPTEGRSALFEIVPLQFRSYDEVTPQMIEAARKRAGIKP